MQRASWLYVVGEWVWELLKTIVIVFVLVFIIRSYLVQPFIIQGASMEPSLHSGEYLLVERVSRLSHEFQRGDIIVFDSAHGLGDDFIKRLIGLPGETVMLRDGEVFIQNSSQPGGFRLSEPYLAPNTRTVTESGSSEQITLKSDQFFVLGDNRGASRDSRSFGPVDRQDIVGKAWLITFPVTSFGIVRPPQYSQIISR